MNQGLGEKVEVGSNKRLLFIDVARATAVVLALFAHFVGTYGPPADGGLLGNYMFFTAMATPLFIIMFGFMMEMVYTQKINNFHYVRKKTLVRSFQCYVAYLVTAVSAILGGFTEWSDLWRVALFAERSRHGNILLLYTVLLLLMPYVILGKEKYGRLFLVTLFSMLGVIVHIISVRDFGDFGYFDLLLTNLLGIGESKGAPSVLFSLLFVLMGMVVASVFRNHGDRIAAFLKQTISILVVLLFCTFIYGVLTELESLNQILSNFGYGRYRGNGNIEYFTVGSILSVFVIVFVYLSVNSLTTIRRLGQGLSPIGRSSLLAFTTGNILLNLTGEKGVEAPYLIVLLIFFGLVYGVSRYHVKLPFYDRIHRFFYFS